MQLSISASYKPHGLATSHINVYSFDKIYGPTQINMQQFTNVSSSLILTPPLFGESLLITLHQTYSFENQHDPNRRLKTFVEVDTD